MCREIVNPMAIMHSEPASATRFTMFLSADGVRNLAKAFPAVAGSNQAATARSRLYQLLAQLGIQEVPRRGGARVGAGPKRKKKTVKKSHKS